MNTLPADHTLIIGIGNEYRGDDAAGLLVVRMLRQAHLPRVRFLESDGEPGDLLDAWESFACVIVVDAVSSGGEPGTIHFADATEHPLPANSGSYSTHGLGLHHAIELGRSLKRLPRLLLVYGIEGRCFAHGRDRTPAVLQSVTQVARQIESQLCVVPLGVMGR